MLRDRDYLLTLAAIWLLFASLSSTSGPNFIITASATNQQQQNQQHQQESSSRHSYFASERPAGAHEQSLQVDQLMSKIRRNLDQPRKLPMINSLQTKQPKTDGQQFALQRPEASSNQNSFSHYANAADQQQQQEHASSRQPNLAELRPGAGQQEPPFREAKEVRVGQLRSSSQRLQEHANTTSTLYLLGHHQPILFQQANNRIDQKETASDEDSLGPSEQQQPPPFTMFAPGNSNPIDQQQNIRQILSNYQRYPQARQLTDQQRQMLTQLQPRPPELHLRPPTTPPPAFGLANNLIGGGGSQQNQQQPLSPLQLLAGPFQAFLPALAAGQQQQQQQQQQPQQLNPNQLQFGRPNGADERPLGPVVGGDNQAGVHQGATRTTSAPASAGIQQPQQPFAGLLNAFNLVPGQQQQTGAQRPPGALGNLQDFYQQLPLYQALLAARQRQEALQAAQRVREQQQQRGAGLGPFNLNAFMPPPQPAQNNMGANGNAPQVPPVRGPAVGFPTSGLVFAPDQKQTRPGQWPESSGNQNLSPPQQQQPFSGNQQQQQQQQQQQGPASNQNGPVQFDDDQQQQNNQPPNGDHNNNNNGQQQQQQQNNQANNNNDKHDNGNQQQQENNNNNNNNNEEAGDQNQGDDGSQQQNNDQSSDQNDQQQGNGGQDGQGNGKTAEEEDPDMKAFQNLANGGDSFADLFPPGILSNNDISEIKTQQAEQAKKQEAEERQRQQQQQQQQQPQQPQQQQPQLNNQPMNQFAGANGQEQPNNNQNAIDNNQGQEQADDNNNNNNESQDEGQDEPQQPDEEEGPAQDSPTAAALTAKSSSASETTNARTKLTKSPGVEYATTTNKQ